MLAALPQPFSENVQHEGNGNKRDAQESQSTARPVHTQIFIHRRCKNGKSRTESAAEQIVASEDARRVRRVRVRQIRQHSLEQQERGDAEEARPDDRHDPVDVAAAAPPEPEEADGHEEAAHHGGLESDLGLDLSVLVELFFLVEVQVAVAGHADERSDEDAEKGETFFAEVEAVDLDEDDGETFEPDV